MPSKGSGSLKGDRLDSRPTAAKLLEVAADLFYRQGYASTSIQDVADAVGLLKGSLYYYIDSKEDLLYRILEETRNSTIGIVEDVRRLDAEPLEKLRIYIERHVEYNARHIPGITVYYHDFALLSPARQKEIGSQNKAYEEFVIGLLEEARRDGKVHEGLDTRLAAKWVFATINYLYTWYKPRGRVKPRDLAVQFAELVLQGVSGAQPPTDS